MREVEEEEEEEATAAFTPLPYRWETSRTVRQTERQDALLRASMRGHFLGTLNTTGMLPKGHEQKRESSAFRARLA